MSVCVCSENASGDALMYRYIVRQIGQTSSTTVDACRVGLVELCKLYHVTYPLRLLTALWTFFRGPVDLPEQSNIN